MPLASRIPTHVALIPDGNRRWALGHGKTKYQGHEQGIRMFKDIIHHAADRGIKYISIWGLSIDNFKKREPREVTGLLRLFKEQFTQLKDDPEVHAKGIKIKVIGEWAKRFPFPVRRAIAAAEAATKNYTNYHLTILLAYNGREEMLETIRKIVKSNTPAKKITAELIKQNLFTHDLPPVDLLIRTAGEPHNSAGFMMWDTADSQLYFTPKFWPDFSPEEFDKALTEYATRDRRLGS